MQARGPRGRGWGARVGSTCSGPGGGGTQEEGHVQEQEEVGQGGPSRRRGRPRRRRGWGAQHRSLACWR